MIPVNLPNISEDDAQAVYRTVADGWISGEAAVVSDFEEAFASYHGKRFGVAVPNGSLALDLVFNELGLGPGDEVILPSFAIISCVSEILRRGATPVFVDSDLSTWNMDVTAVESLVTERTRAILVVHIYGLPVDMDPLIAISERFSIPIIEDAAEAHGLIYKDRVCGSMGFASTFSFYANKNVTAGEGGMIISDDEEFIQRLRYLRNLAFSPQKRFVHEEIGWNLRFTGIQAALGLSQLDRLEETIDRRRSIASTYREALHGIAGASMAPAQTPTGLNDYWVVGVTLDPDYYVSAEQVAKRLLKREIQTRPFFFPLHKQPVYIRSEVFRNYSLPVAEYLGDYGLYLPNGLGLTQDLIDRAAAAVREVLST